MMRKDLFIRPRDKRFYNNRVVFIIPFALMMIVGFASVVSEGDTSAAGLSFFHQLSAFAVFLLSIMAPIAGVTSMNQEHSGHLDALLMTGVSFTAVFHAKFVTALCFLVLYLLSLFPVLVFVVVLGGVAFLQTFLALCVMLGVAFWGTSLGCVCSVFSLERSHIFVPVVLSFAFFYVLPGMIGFFWMLFYGGSNEYLQAFLSPFAALGVAYIGDPDLMLIAFANAFFNIMVGCFLLLMGAPFGRRKTRRHVTYNLDNAPKRCSDHAWTGNPVAWRDHRFTYDGDSWRLFSKVLFVLVAVMVSALLILAWIDAFWAMPIHIALTIMGFAFVAVFCLVWVTLATRLFQAEKRNRSMDVLLLTTLSNREIVNGKFWALWKTCRHWCVFVLMSGLSLLLLNRFSADSCFMFATMLAYMGSAMAVGVIVAANSLRYSVGKALAMGVVYLLVSGCLKSLLTAPFQFSMHDVVQVRLTSAFAGLAIDVFVLWLVVVTLASCFRVKALEALDP